MARSYAGVANFDGSQDSIAVGFDGIVAAVPKVLAGVTIASTVEGGPVGVDVTNPTATGCTLTPSARFVGQVVIIAIG